MVFKTAIAAFWMLVVGLLCAYLELTQVRLGHRIHLRQKEVSAGLEDLRHLEVRYNQLVSPDVLERELREFFQDVRRGSAMHQ